MRAPSTSQSVSVSVWSTSKASRTSWIDGPEHRDRSQVLAELVQQHLGLEDLAHHAGGDPVAVARGLQAVERPQRRPGVIGALAGGVGGEVGQPVVEAVDAREGRADGVQARELLDVGVRERGDGTGHFRPSLRVMAALARPPEYPGSVLETRSPRCGRYFRPVAPQFIFTMRGLSRFHPPDRQVLENINLSFYPGAKIGVLGANGAGKSSLLRIMAGEDDGYSGEARLTPGFSVGLLHQEPHLDESKDVLGNVMDGVGETATLLERYDAVLAGWSDPDADYDKLGEQQAQLEKEIEAADAWDLKRTIDIAMDALRLPPGDADVTTLSGGERRRVALCRLLLVAARPAAARRAHQPPRRGVRRVARAVPRRVPRHRRRGHPRPVLPRQRRGLDPRARPRARHPVGGELLVVAGAEGGPARAGGEERSGEAAHARPRARVDPPGPARPAGQGQGPHQRLRSARRRGRGRRRSGRPARHLHPARAAPRRPRGGGGAPHQGLRRPPAHRRLLVLAPTRWDRRGDRSRTVRARRRCSG